MSDPSAAAMRELTAATGALGLDITTGQADALLEHLVLLQRWNATYNLTAVRDPAAMLRQHLVDCLAMVPALKRHFATHPQARRLLDAGSGGGLPGVVLAVMLPELDVTCADAVGKKAAFVRQVAGTLSLPNLQAVHGRVEALKLAPFDIITSRAFASLADFVRWTEARLAPGGVWVAMKGATPDDELQSLPATVEVFHVEPLRVPGLDAQRCLVWMRRAASA
jgi:16S rRNA (guanine527-N7)-methyltransferase